MKLCFTHRDLITPYDDTDLGQQVGMWPDGTKPLFLTNVE